jgi:hypothetical protein
MWALALSMVPEILAMVDEPIRLLPVVFTAEANWSLKLGTMVV